MGSHSAPSLFRRLLGWLLRRREPAAWCRACSDDDGSPCDCTADCGRPNCTAWEEEAR
jgi:hypothetical protein